MTFLVDTNVLSELRRRPPNPAVVTWFSKHPASVLYLSVVTLGDIRKGIELLADGDRKQALSDWLRIDLPAFFAGRILAVDSRVADRWGKMLAAAGRSVPAIDSLLAATASEHGLVLVTRNVRDFSAFPIVTVDPWLTT